MPVGISLRSEPFSIYPGWERRLCVWIGAMELEIEIWTYTLMTGHRRCGLEFAISWRRRGGGSSCPGEGLEDEG